MIRKGGIKVPLLQSRYSILEYVEMLKIKISEFDKTDQNFYLFDLIVL